jgi:chemotaxis protein CheD
MANVEIAAGGEWRRRPDAVERKALYLQPGRLVVSPDPAVITTILGSCVAICLWDERLRAGGMNHYMLPFETAPQSDSPRFGTIAWKELLGGMLGLGARRESLRAAIFGGACVMATFRVDGEHVGMRNVRLADMLLADERILVVHRDVAGRRGRKVVYETDSGHFTVHTL